MGGPRGSSERTKARILAAARELFAARGITEVTVRDIAAVAGVNHALVHRYFGTKEEMVAEILRHEVAAYATMSQDIAARAGGNEDLRHVLTVALTEARTTVLLMMRAELAGLEPEKTLAGQPRPLGVLAEAIRRQQQEAGSDGGHPDPALVSAVVGASIFSFICMAPWLMVAIGLQPEDFAARRDEIVAILVGLVACASGSATMQ